MFKMYRQRCLCMDIDVPVLAEAETLRRTSNTAHSLTSMPRCLKCFVTFDMLT